MTQYIGEQERLDTSNSFRLAMEKASGNYGEVPQEFRYVVLSALLKRRIDTHAINPQELEALIASLWNNGRMQDAWAADQGLDPDNFITDAQLEKVMDDALFSPGNSPDPALVKRGVGLLFEQNRSLTAEQQEFALSGVGGSKDVRDIVMSVAAQYGVDPALALAVAQTESGLDPNRVGDNGHSVGLFQLHDQGMGAGMGDSRYDARTNAERGISSLAATIAAHPEVRDPIVLAVLSQRPALTIGGQNIGWTEDPSVIAQTDAYASYAASYGPIKSGKLPSINYSPTYQVDQLAKQYPGLESEFTSMFGRKPTAAEFSAMLAGGTERTQVQDFLRGLPSHIGGMNMGQYHDLRTSADAISDEMFGHKATDGIVRDLFNQGKMSKTAIKFFYTQLDIAGKMDPKTYNSIYAANQPHMSAIYNERGFDPRIAIAQHSMATAPSSTPNSEAARVADQMAVGPSVDEVPGYDPLRPPSFSDRTFGIPDTPPPPEFWPQGSAPPVQYPDNSEGQTP